MILSEAERLGLRSNQQFMQELERRQQQATANQGQRDALVAAMQALQSEYDQRVGVLQREIDELSKEYSLRWQALRDQLTQAGG